MPEVAVSARTLFRDGRLAEAIQLLGAELRDNPTDVRRRTFLFELLAFAGEHDRAEKQLDVLARAGNDAQMGGLLYHAALHAERTRREKFSPFMPGVGAAPRPVAGTINGRPFTSLTDADPRLGARLEVYAAGGYLWIPLEHVASIRMEPPKRLRDTLWAPAIVRTGPGFRGVELGEVLLPALTPLASQHADDRVRLGRVTEFEALPEGDEAPVGQKLWLVDGEEFPLLELRELDVVSAA